VVVAIGLGAIAAPALAQELVASAGPDKTVRIGDKVRLEGKARGGLPQYAFRWVQIAGPVQTLTDATLPTATVQAAKAGSSVYQLIATDHSGAIAYDEMTVAVASATARACDTVPTGRFYDR